MLDFIKKKYKGYVFIEIKGSHKERFINICMFNGIVLWNLDYSKDAYTTNISIKDYRKIRSIARKTKTKVKILKKEGMPFWINRYKRQRLFFPGACICFFIIIIMNLFLWEINIYGNKSCSTDAILEFLEENDIHIGTIKSGVDCQNVAQMLRDHYSNMIWVSCSLNGSRLNIMVKENTMKPFSSDKTNHGQDIVANEDCVIKSMITRTGTPLVKAGDQIKKGDILVLGRMDLRNDAGEIVDYKYVDAEADIIGTMKIPYRMELKNDYFEKEYYNLEKRFYYIKTDWFLAGIGSLSHPYKEYERFSKSKKMGISTIFNIPIEVGIYITKPYEKIEKKYTPKEMENRLYKQYKTDLGNLRKKGVEIIENSVKIDSECNSASLRGWLTIHTPIGKKKPSERIEITDGIKRIND